MAKKQTVQQSIYESIMQANLKGQRATLREVLARSPMFDAVALEIKGRMIRVGPSHWVADFASCNYLGYDLDEEIMAAIEPALKKWGVHPSWCRLVASPSLYEECEAALGELIGAPAVLILPTVTLIHIGVMPALMGKDGVMFLDKFAHMTMYEAAKMARDSGSKLLSFASGRLDILEEQLALNKDNPKKLILIDGVYSMTGKYPDLPRLSALAKRYGALVYIDDAHGFGVVGERPDDSMPYGHRGNGIVRHFGMTYEADNLLYVGGLSKAYSSLAAFVAASKELKTFFKAYATPYDLSGPCPTASLASLLAGIHVDAKRGDACRKRLYHLSKRSIDGLRQLGFAVDNDTYFPILSIWIGDTERLIHTAKILWDSGILITLGPYPMVPKGEEVLRITVTAANTDEQVDTLIKAFSKVRDYITGQGAPLSPPTQAA